MNNIESINLESLINASSLGNYSTAVPDGMALVSASDGGTMLMANGPLAMVSNGSINSIGSMMLSSTSGDPLMSTFNLDDLTSTSFAHHLSADSTSGSHGNTRNAQHHSHNGTSSHITNHHHHHHHHHSDLHSLLTTSSSSSFLNSINSDPINTISGSSESGGFLDQFDTASGSHLLQSFTLKEDDYEALDVDLLGMLSSNDLDEPSDHVGLSGDNSSITDHLTPAQYNNLLDDCLDHISCTNSSLVSSIDVPASNSCPTSITTVSTSSALNELTSTQFSANGVLVLNRQNHSERPSHQLNHAADCATDRVLQQTSLNHEDHHHQQQNRILQDPAAHHHQDLFSTHHQHHQFETINFADCPDLTEDLADQLVAAVTNSSLDVIHGNDIVAQSANLAGISCNGDDLLTPILTTVTSSLTGVVATTTTNAGHPVGETNVDITDRLLTLKEDNVDLSVSGVPSFSQPCPKSEGGNTNGQAIAKQLEHFNSSNTSCTKPKKQQKKLSNSNTSTSSAHSPSPTNGVAASGESSNLSTSLETPESPSMAKAMKEEVCRLTVCPLCDNAKSFCSSSSVTRHLRSVHKLNDLLGTRNCYCLLCARFIEDLPEFFSHLKSDHQLLQQPNPIKDLYVRHHFKSFEEFMKWKANTLEKQTGCKYERCYTNEYSRNIYFKCSAIRITRITLAGKCSTSNKEPPALDASNGGSSKGSPGSGSEAGGDKANPNMISEIVLESSFDARMYPCTSSVRLTFRYTGIEAIEFPYHLGHKLDSNRRDLCLTSMSSPNAQRMPLQHVVHLNATSTTKATIASTSASGGSGPPQTHHIKIKSEVIPGGIMAPSQQHPTPATSTTSVVNGPKTTTTNHQLVFIPSKTQQPVAQALALANTSLSPDVGGNANLSSTSLSMPTAVQPTSSSQAKSKSPRKRNRDSKSSNSSVKSKVAKLEFQTVELPKSKQKPKTPSASVKIAQQMSNVASSAINKPTSLTSFLPSIASAEAFNNSSAAVAASTSTASAILTAINGNNTITLAPVQTNTAGTSHLVTPIALNTGQSLQQVQPLSIGSVAPLKAPSSLSSVSSSQQYLLKSPASTPVDTSILIDNLASDIFLDASYDTDPIDPKSLKLEEGRPLQQTTLVIKPYSEDAGIGLGLQTFKKEDFKSESKNSLIIVPAETTSLAAVGAAPGNNSVTAGTTGCDNDDGLGIVPIEKAMEMVQESIRPRKEHLRKRFGELLDLCLTESDIELVENSLEQLISTNLLQ